MRKPEKCLCHHEGSLICSEQLKHNSDNINV
nr:MAG TPA: hypothetical protein [Caudoviricetes sp.]